MTQEEAEKLERKSWIIQVFDPKRKPDNPSYGRWLGVHASTKGQTLHQVDYLEADQYELEEALKFSLLFSKEVTAKDWQNFDWSVFNFRTHERIPISAL